MDCFIVACKVDLTRRVTIDFFAAVKDTRAATRRIHTYSISKFYSAVLDNYCMHYLLISVWECTSYSKSVIYLQPSAHGDLYLFLARLKNSVPSVTEIPYGPTLYRNKTVSTHL